MNRRRFLLSSAAALASRSFAQKKPDLKFASASVAAAAIRKRTVSSVDLTKLCFQRIAEYHSKLNAVVISMQEPALKRAAAADAAIARRENWGPFHGVPVTIKESFAILGTPCTWGLDAFRNQPSTFTAVAVERLERAGAVVIGKTNVPVMLSDWQSYNPVYGTTNNPWDIKLTPGGSTGGGAAALAAGIGFLALGSDIGGSIRVPADFCGVYGHKPSLGVVPLGGHVPPDVPASAAFVEDNDLAVAGPLARAPEDLREALRVLGGPAEEAAEGYRWSLPEPRQKRLRDFRVGYVIDGLYAKPEPEALAVLDAALQAIQQAGAKVERGWPPGFEPEAALQTYMYLLSATLNARLPQSERARMRALYQDNPRDPWYAAVFEPHSRWVAENDRRFAARAAWQSWFKTHDVFLAPTAIVPAFPHDHSEPKESRMLHTASGTRRYMDLLRWIAPATLAGLPATVAPAGLTKSNLPIGIQIIGPFLEDATPIEFAALLKNIVGGFQPPPGY